MRRLLPAASGSSTACTSCPSRTHTVCCVRASRVASALELLAKTRQLAIGVVEIDQRLFELRLELLVFGEHSFELILRRLRHRRHHHSDVSETTAAANPR